MANETTDNIADQKLDAPTVKKVYGAAKEAASGMQDLLDKQKKAAEHQKDPNRPPTRVSLEYGKPTIVFDNNKAVKVLSDKDTPPEKGKADPGDSKNKTSSTDEISKTRVLPSDTSGHKPADTSDKTIHHKPDTAQEKYEAAHKHLQDAAEKNIKDPKEKAKFNADMETFEKRAEERHLSPHEKAKVYEQLSRLLEKPGEKFVDHAHRVVLAEQCMSHAANPNAIDQGQHETCQTTAVEANMFTKHPSAAIKLVADVSTTGQYTAPDGTTIKLDSDQLKPDDEGRNNPPVDGYRSYASQVFQLTAVNLAYNPPGKYKYVQHVPKAGDKEPDYGEHLMVKNASGHWVQHWNEGKAVKSPYLNDDQVVKMGDRLDPDNPTIYLSHKENTLKTGKGYPDMEMGSEVEFKHKLQSLKDGGKLPVLVRVETGNEPLYTESGDGAAGGSGGAHVVRVTDYDPVTGKVQIDNQWGSSVDHNSHVRALTAHELYFTMRPPDSEDQIKGLRKDMKEERLSDPRQSLEDRMELLRRQHMSHQLSDANFKKGMTEAENELRQIVVGEEKHHKAALSDKLELIQHEHDRGALSDKNYTKYMLEAVKEEHTLWVKQLEKGTFSPEEYQRSIDKLLLYTEQLPIRDRLALLQAENHQNILSGEKYFEQVIHASDDTIMHWSKIPADKQKKVLHQLEEINKTLPPDEQRVLEEKIKRMHKS